MSDTRNWHIGLITLSNGFQYLTETKISKNTIHAMDTIIRKNRSDWTNGYPARSELARYLYANPHLMQVKSYSIEILNSFDNSADADMYFNQMKIEAENHNADLLNRWNKSEDRVR